MSGTALSQEEVRRVALLARLLPNDNELDAMTGQLGRILEYIDLLSTLNTDGVEPMAHAIEISNVFADDEPQPSLPRSDAIANAPKADEQCFLVPAVLGER
jgi:aspartyl-tRNA(Asn)/glutamyl-tRNA(Gln) amidotransferase subunit C